MKIEILLLAAARRSEGGIDRPEFNSPRSKDDLKVKREARTTKENELQYDDVLEKQAIGMLNVLAPGKLVLTLQSTPPFVVESALALALTILLAAPLIVRVYFLLEPLKTFDGKTIWPSRRRRRHRRRHDNRVSRSLVTHYPARIATDSTSSSSLHLESTRKMNSMSVLENSDGMSKISSRLGEQIGDRRSKKRSSLNRPSSLARHPIIDISNLDYKAYRHKLIEATLRKQYDDSQPPGDVVLNSLHLNSADSVIGARLNDRYDHSFFDFLEEYYDVTEATSRKNAELPRPLDHFLSKGTRRPRTIETETETIPDESIVYRSCVRENDRNDFLENDNSKFAKLPDTDNNGNPYGVHSLSRSISLEDNVSTILARSDLNSELQVSRRETIPSRSRECAAKTGPGDSTGNNNSPPFADSSTRKEWRTRERPASAGNASMSPKGCALSRAVTSPPRWKSATKSPRPETSATKKNLEVYSTVTGFPSSNKCHAETGKSNFISASSSEVVSICSDSSSKCRRDEMSRRSRESSISPRNRASSRPPWMSGNLHGTSFNRKYGNIRKNPAKCTKERPARSMRESGLSCQRPAVSNREDRPKESVVSRNPGPSRQRAASFIASQEKKFIGTSIEQCREHLTMSGQRQRQDDKLKDVGSAAQAESNERGQTLKTPDSAGEGISAITRDNVTSSLSSRAQTQVYPTPRVAVSSVHSPPAVSPTTRITAQPRLTNRRDEGSRKDHRNTLPGRSKSPNILQDQSERLNRGERRLRSAENPSKGASLSPKIELSVQVINPADDTDKSAIPDDGKHAQRAITRIDPRGNLGAADEGNETRPVSNTKAAAGKDIKSNNINGVSRSKVPKIMQNLRTGVILAGANNLPKSDKSDVSTSHPARRDANSEAKSGLNGAKLHTRSNDAVDKMKCDESSASKASSILRQNHTDHDDETKACEQDIVGKVNPDDELQLPRRDSKMDLVMNSGLKRYIKMLKQTLLNDNDNNKEDVISLASLSLSDAILSEQKTSLSPEETQELKSVLNKIEKNPELLCKKSDIQNSL
ncbi:uncharacterized protein [Anoplolepis gracilipes]|uniref:uncharacterized protein n=1 Tax=Anoplolepis gracilipes TaxID=354296 RepID=UPI003BA074AE